MEFFVGNNDLISSADFILFSNAESFNTRQIANKIDMWLTVARDSKSDNTLKGYKRDWDLFCDWCDLYSNHIGNPVSHLPASTETILAFIDYSLGRRAPASIRKYLSTISKVHDVAEVINPVNHILVQTAKASIGTGLKRQRLEEYRQNEQNLEDTTIGVDIRHHNFIGQQRQAAPFHKKDIDSFTQLSVIEPIIEVVGNAKKDIKINQHNSKQMKLARDRALLNLAYDTLMRSSEIVNVCVSDFTWRKDGGAILTLGARKDNRRGETDARNVSVEAGIEIKRWLDMAKITSGYIALTQNRHGSFILDKRGNPKPMTTRSLLNIYKEAAILLGKNPDDFSCHSTRVGALQDMAENNISMAGMMQSGGWKTEAMISRYLRKIDSQKGGMAQLEKLRRENTVN
jgi:integrase